MKISKQKFLALQQALSQNYQILCKQDKIYQILVAEDNIINVFTFDFNMDAFFTIPFTLPQFPNSTGQKDDQIIDIISFMYNSEYYLFILLKNGFLTILNSQLQLISFMQPFAHLKPLTPLKILHDPKNSQYIFSVAYSNLFINVTFSAFLASISTPIDIHETANITFKDNLLTVVDDFTVTISGILIVTSYDISTVDLPQNLQSQQMNLIGVNKSGLVKICPFNRFDVDFVTVPQQIIEGAQDFRQKLAGPLIAQGVHGVQYIVNQVNGENFVAVHYAGEFLILKNNLAFFEEKAPEAKKVSFLKRNRTIRQKQVGQQLSVLQYDDHLENQNLIVFGQSGLIYIFRLGSFDMVSVNQCLNDENGQIQTMAYKFVHQHKLIIYQLKDTQMRRSVFSLPQLILLSCENCCIQIGLTNSLILDFQESCDLFQISMIEDIIYN